MLAVWPFGALQTSNPFELAIKIALTALGVAILAGGAAGALRSVRRPYGPEELKRDIVGLNNQENANAHAVAIIMEDGAYPKKVLMSYSVRWECYLFPDAWMVEPVSVESGARALKSRLSSQLRVAEDRIHTEYRQHLSTRKMSQSDKIMKRYDFYFYIVTVEGDISFKSQEEFSLRGKAFRWMSIDDMLLDADIRDKNRDVVGFVRSNLTNWLVTSETHR